MKAFLELMSASSLRYAVLALCQDDVIESPVNFT